MYLSIVCMNLIRNIFSLMCILFTCVSKNHIRSSFFTSTLMFFLPLLYSQNKYFLRERESRLTAHFVLIYSTIKTNTKIDILILTKFQFTYFISWNAFLTFVQKGFYYLFILKTFLYSSGLWAYNSTRSFAGR